MEDKTEKHQRQEYTRPPECEKVAEDLTLEQCIERRGELSRLMAELGESTDNIQGQLDNRLVSSAADEDWVRRARGARRYYSRMYGDHQRAYWNVNRRISKLENADGARRFLRAAKSYLPKAEYNAIWSLAGEAGDSSVAK